MRAKVAWNNICKIVVKSTMQSTWKKLSAAQLRTIFINEMRRFALALEFGASLGDLQEIKEQMKEMADCLSWKEKDENRWGSVQQNLVC